MKTLPLVLALAAFASTPAVEAAEAPCLVGDTTCFVGIEWYVCVTEPCDSPKVCVNYGAVCLWGILP